MSEKAKRQCSHRFSRCSCTGQQLLRQWPVPSSLLWVSQEVGPYFCFTFILSLALLVCLDGVLSVLGRTQGAFLVISRQTTVQRCGITLNNPKNWNEIFLDFLQNNRKFAFKAYQSTQYWSAIYSMPKTDISELVCNWKNSEITFQDVQHNQDPRYIRIAFPQTKSDTALNAFSSPVCFGFAVWFSITATKLTALNYAQY